MKMKWTIVLSIVSVKLVLCSKISGIDENLNVGLLSRFGFPENKDKVQYVPSKLSSLDYYGLHGSKDLKFLGSNEDEDIKLDDTKVKLNAEDNPILSDAKESLDFHEDLNIDENLSSLETDLSTIIPENSVNTSINYSSTEKIDGIIVKESDKPSDKNFFQWLWNPSGSTTTSTTAIPVTEKPKNCPKCQCGMTNNPNRIVGGTETSILQYPWMAVLWYRGKFICAASVITDSYLLTAAHCVDRFDKKLMKVQIREHDRSTQTEVQSMTYDVLELIKQPGYSSFSYHNDIALIKIDGRIKFEGLMRPVCLPDRGPTYAGKNGIIIGWGALEESGMTSQTLQEAVVPIISNAECRGTKYPARKITDSMMCAGYYEGGKDSCQGDSGGPLHVADSSIHKIVGIVSWGEGCASPGYPGVYARVNRFVTWIEYNTRNSCYCS